MDDAVRYPTREQLLHQLYEAAELEHNLMCTYLYAAFSLRSGTEEGLTEREAAATAEWRRAIVQVAIDEMGHLAAVWNITAALGGAPRFGRNNFPLDSGVLPASVVVRLAPFDMQVLQHFIYLERPEGSQEPDGEGFAPEFRFSRNVSGHKLTPMGMDYDTVGQFYAALAANLREFVARVGEPEAFCGDPAFQLSAAEVSLTGAAPVLCSKTALAAFTAIVEQGEGAPLDRGDSHFNRFIAVRTEFEELQKANPDFHPSFPAAVNPVQRPPVRAGGRVWIEDPEAAIVVDIANTGYALMLRLLAYSYSIRRPDAEKSLVVDLAVGLMHAVTLLGEQAARLPAGPSNPNCNAGMSFAALRDAAAFTQGSAARTYFIERLDEMANGAAQMCRGSNRPRVQGAMRYLANLNERAGRGFAAVANEPAPATPVATAQSSATAAVRPASLAANDMGGARGVAAASASPASRIVDGIESVEGEHLVLNFEAKRCIHARFCVTWTPQVYLANVKGPWINPDATSVASDIEIAHVCPSGAITYRRKDGGPEEAAPPVNLVAIREGGPYAIRAQMRIDGRDAGFRATLCRCGASKNKPFCDGSHHEVAFAASGEPETGVADMLPVRDGVLAIDPLLDGPLQVRGNLEITSGTGRVVARVTQARLCRCGGSGTKPFCDGTHAKIGFRST